MLYICSMKKEEESKVYRCEHCKAEFCKKCEQNTNKKTIKNVVGKAFVDIFKYVVTAVIITTFLGGIEHMWLIYTVGAIIAFLALGIGFYFMNNKNK